MMGKPITGRSFGGCIRYVVNKPEAKILSVEGVRMQNAAAIIQDLTYNGKCGLSWGKQLDTWYSAGAKKTCAN